MRKKRGRIISDEVIEKGKRTLSTAFVFSAFILMILIAALIMASGIVMLIQELRGTEVVFDLWLTLLMVVGISAVIGYLLTLLLGSTVLLKPIERLVGAMSRVAEGDFHTRLDFEGTVFNNKTFGDIATGFNKMAEELGNTELLRSDFVNNFSHEFKTPIVSIAGFADLLRSHDLGEEEREHYLTVIVDESHRLASLATNILNLTRIENQSILTDISTFNLSEQIRSVVLLLESKWASRGIVPILEFDEIEISANEQLLKEVWLNLIDNAIKFSPEMGEIEVAISASRYRVTVDITNSGKEIPDEVKEKIFMKFYQADESHSGEGSGVGLAVVKRVIDLHRGRITVKSAEGKNTFSVSLPVIGGSIVAKR